MDNEDDHVDDVNEINDRVGNVENDVYDDAIPNQYLIDQVNAGMQNFMYYYNGPLKRSFANIFKTPYRTSNQKGLDWLNELLVGHEDRFKDNLRMTRETFLLLCHNIRKTGMIPEHDRTRVLLEESVAIFVQTIGMHNRQINSAERFQRSNETISRHVHYVCDALCSMAKDYIRPHDLTVTPPEIENNPRFYPYFKDCVGAIDGTIVPGWAPARKHGSYRSRKAIISQNVMAACDFNLKFTFVLAGWEGSANDSRVFLNALRNPEYNFPWPPPGKYYLVDCGYTNFPGFLAPYRNERYHLPEWRGQNGNPRSKKENFNRVHSSGRNHIERTFGMLKNRFPILKGLMPNYDLTTQADIVVACCVLHNFIRTHCEYDPFYAQYEDIDTEVQWEENAGPSQFARVPELSDNDLWQQSMLRDAIAQQLWDARNHHG